MSRELGITCGQKFISPHNKINKCTSPIQLSNSNILHTQTSPNSSIQFSTIKFPCESMATIANLLANPPSKLASTTEISPFSNYNKFSSVTLFSSPKRSSNRRLFSNVKATSAASSDVKKANNKQERVQKVHNAEEFDEALKVAKNKLVVVEYATREVDEDKKIYPFLVELSKQCNDVEFLLVMGDESEQTRELCRREKIEKVPHFSFYKSMEKIHEEDAIGPDQLVGDVLYYGDSHAAVSQLHSREDVETLIKDHKEDGKLVVLDVGLKHCGPCVKVYPTVIKLSRSMADTVVFARMNGDENDSCMQFLRDMNVVEVPTFVFIRDGEICGRYVGSGKGELIGEILRYQGVRVTY